MSFSMFTATSDPAVLDPTEFAQSLWAGGQMHGVAISSSLARCIEKAIEHRADLRPARMTVDLFKPVQMAPCHFEATVVREGGRIALIDAVLSQDGEPRARASAVFLKPTQTPDGEVWHSGHQPSPPPLDKVAISDEPRVPFFKSDSDWSDNFFEHQNAGRKETWQTALPTVLGETTTPFQAVAGIADSASLVTNWSTRGVQFINTDITVTLARACVGVEVGLEALDHVESEGIAVGSATVFDRQGVLGTAVVTALANAHANVDFSKVEFDEEGMRTV
jgi:hypothetical protein